MLAPFRVMAWLAMVCMGAALVASSGCGTGHPTTVPVSGTVTLDGNPIAGAAVMLVPPQGQGLAKAAHGVTDDQGRFTLGTFETGDGALPGKYGVTVIKKETSGILAGPDGLEAGIAPGGIKETWIIPQRYSTTETSGLEVEVRSGMEPLKLELTSK